MAQQTTPGQKPNDSGQRQPQQSAQGSTGQQKQGENRATQGRDQGGQERKPDAGARTNTGMKDDDCGCGPGRDMDKERATGAPRGSDIGDARSGTAGRNEEKASGEDEDETNGPQRAM